MTVTVRTLVSDVETALAAVLSGYTISTGTPYGLRFSADDAAFKGGGKVKAVLLYDVLPDGEQRVGGIQDLRATIRLEMYREAEAALDGGSMPVFREEVTAVLSALLGLANCSVARAATIAQRSPFMERICHRADIYARFIRLCPEEA